MTVGQLMASCSLMCLSWPGSCFDSWALYPPLLLLSPSPFSAVCWEPVCFEQKCDKELKLKSFYHHREFTYRDNVTKLSILLAKQL